MRLIPKNQKKYLKIYEEYRSLMADGSTPMEVYRYLGKKHRRTVSGIRYAIKSAEDMLRPAAPPIPEQNNTNQISYNMENKCKDCKYFQMGTNCIDGKIIFDPFAKALCIKYKLQTSYNQKAGPCFEDKTKTLGEQLELFQ